jgi:hypothetical protein
MEVVKVKVNNIRKDVRRFFLGGFRFGSLLIVY